MGLRIFLTLIVTMACALPAAAAHVTSFTVTPNHLVGAPASAIATVGVAFEPGENTHGPFETPTLTSVSIAVGVLPGAGISFQCGNYLPIGATSVSCVLTLAFPVTSRQTVTLHAQVLNNNYTDQYRDIIGMDLPFTFDPPPAPGGTLRVTTNLDAASFTITGPATFAGSGTSFARFNAPAGIYTVTFAAVAGYLTPEPQTKTLSSRGSLTFAAFYQVQRELRVRAWLGDDEPGPPAGVKLPTEARVPLGALLHLETVDQNGNELPAAFALGTASLDGHVAETALFSTATLIRYTGAPINGAIFQSVHNGTVTVGIAPFDSALPSGTLTVIVEDPKSLGSTSPDVDPDIYAVAHRYGVPPQFIKAHADKESTSRFNRLAYRYEPIGPFVGDLRAISRGSNLRRVMPYSDYRFATVADKSDPALTFGAMASQEDVNVRDGLRILKSKGWD